MMSPSSDRFSRRDLGKLLLALASAPVAVHAADDPYPNRPIHVIVPQPAGGTGDIVTRMVCDRLASRLGQPVVIDNRAGAGGRIGAMQAARSAPDGYTLVMASPAFATYESMFPKEGFNPTKELSPVAMLGSVPVALIVRADSPFLTLGDFVRYAKSNPGKATFASAGNGALSHLIGAWFAREADVDIVHVPYSGTAPALTALLSGQVSIYFDPMSGAELLKAARVRALATAGDTRTPMLPDVPTVAELGYKVSGSVWLGIMAPIATPRPLVERLNREIDAVLQQDDLRRQLEARLVFPKPVSVEQFSRFFNRESDNWNRVVRENGIKVE